MLGIRACFIIPWTRNTFHLTAFLRVAMTTRWRGRDQCSAGSGLPASGYRKTGPEKAGDLFLKINCSYPTALPIILAADDATIVVLLGREKRMGKLQARL